ncbi:unnamed protein product, partial [Owenia fusiformis]
MPISYCAVKGCANNTRKLKKWAKIYCMKHVCLRENKLCECSPPFHFFTFPTEKKNPERRAIWIKLVNRRNVDGTRWVPDYSARICSHHFVDGYPSANNPDPTLKLGYSSSLVQVHQPRKAPKRRLLLQNTEAVSSKRTHIDSVGSKHMASSSKSSESEVPFRKASIQHPSIKMTTLTHRANSLSPKPKETSSPSYCYITLKEDGRQRDTCGIKMKKESTKQPLVYCIQNTLFQNMLADMQKRHQFCDTIFLLHGGVELLAHKVVVCAYSPVVHRICSNDKTQQVNIKIDLCKAKVKTDAVRMALDFMYGRSIEFTESDAGNLKRIATLLKITVLDEYVTEAMQSKHTEDETYTGVYIKEEPLDWNESSGQTSVKTEPEDQFEKLVSELENQQYMDPEVDMSDTIEADDKIADDIETPLDKVNATEYRQSPRKNIALKRKVPTATQQPSASTSTLCAPQSTTKFNKESITSGQAPDFHRGKKVKKDINIFDERSKIPSHVEGKCDGNNQSPNIGESRVDVIRCLQSKVYKCIVADCKWRFWTESPAELQMHNLIYHASIVEDKQNESQSQSALQLMQGNSKQSMQGDP